MKKSVTDKIINTNKFTSIILLTDFSIIARNALNYAISAFENGVSYTLVNAYDARTSTATLLNLNDVLRKESEQKLKEEKEWIKSKYPEYKLDLVSYSIFGSPIDAINELVNKNESNLVIMGTKGVTGIEAVLFGSVAASVIRAKIAPVISVPPNYKFLGLKEIIYASDWKSINSTATIEPIVKLQQQFNSRVTVLSVQNNRTIIEKEIKKLNADHVIFTTSEDTDIVDLITLYCDKKNADLLVLHPRNSNFFDRLFHKSISNKLVQQAHLPILSLEKD
jgi:nucleotide-binding universal stress UspA family protein